MKRERQQAASGMCCRRALALALRPELDSDRGMAVRDPELPAGQGDVVLNLERLQEV
jgi:hypothetical protein